MTKRQPQPYVAIKVLVTMQELGQVVPPLTAEVFAWLADHGAKPSGQPFWKYNVIDMDRDPEDRGGCRGRAAGAG